MLYTFKIHGKTENSESPVMLIAGYSEGFFFGAKIWMSHWNYTTIGKCPTLLTVEDIHKGVTQCSERLTMEEIGQLCGGN